MSSPFTLNREENLSCLRKEKEVSAQPFAMFRAQLQLKPRQSQSLILITRSLSGPECIHSSLRILTCCPGAVKEWRTHTLALKTKRTQGWSYVLAEILSPR